MARRAASTSGFPDEPGTAAAPATLQVIVTASGRWQALAPGEALPAGAARASLQEDSTTGRLIGDDTQARGVRAIMVGSQEHVRLVGK